MFEGFARVWTPIALSEELGRSKPLSFELAGTPVVLFRDAEGRPAALVDRCPHRGVKLSLGKLKDGCIECPFHGWRLNGQGAVTHVPWNPDAKLDTLRGWALPIRELAGQLWVFTDPFEPPTDEPQVNERLLAPGVRISGFSIVWRTHWTRAMENMLDWPHLPFVHRNTIGRAMRNQSGGRMDVISERRPWGLHTHIQIDGRDEPATLDLRWPNQMNLDLSSAGRFMMQAVACIPIDDRSTRMLLVMGRDFLTSSVFDWAFHWANSRIASEDKDVVETSFPVAIPPASEERSVRTDGPTLAFRKRYFAELAESRAIEPPRLGALSLVSSSEASVQRERVAVEARREE
jgi:phenylpropionate dioxygenase-like ring-hydroxylating dioxygenase large terminal subunit